jgi:hypothetical protein
MNRIISRFMKFLNLLALIFVVPTVLPALVLAEEPYVFERMWPYWQHPWYFQYPTGIATDKTDNVYVLDSNYVFKFTSDAQLVTKWGFHLNGRVAYDIAIDRDGNAYVAIPGLNSIQKFSESGVLIAEWNVEGSDDGEFKSPCAITTDETGNVYVVDAANNRIQKFTSDGQFLAKWGSQGSSDGQFNFFDNLFDTYYIAPRIAIDNQGNVFVSDTFNHRIQKFNSNGQFITKWGSEGSGDGEFRSPTGIAIDKSGKVNVIGVDNDRIQQFTSDGKFIRKWGRGGSAPGEFVSPRGNIASDSNDNIYISDTYNHRIQKFSSDGQFLTKWGPQNDDGEFINTFGIAADLEGNTYVVDVTTNRVQKFSPTGNFITKWGNSGTEEGDFIGPIGIAVNSKGGIYVVDQSNFRIQQFSSSGVFLSAWGKEGYGNGEFSFSYKGDYGGGVAIDGNDYVYVLDSGNYRVQKFTPDGQFVTKWGSEGIGDGQFNYPRAIAADSNGFVYVADRKGNHVQKFSSEGTFLLKWGSAGTGDGQFYNPCGLATDKSGNVYVVDDGNRRIQKFTSEGVFISKWGGQGTGEGQFLGPLSVCIGPDNRVYVGDVLRVQVFSNGEPTTLPGTSKAIIVAGGGPYERNNLWEATQMCANYAYRALTYQGYTKENLYYLSADTSLDLDGNGILDDVDANATNANLQYAIQTWAGDAEDLFIYMVDHGGNGTFRMGETELLGASDLDSWLDALQQTISGPVTMVYDACESGSFLPSLTPPSGKQRVLATSTSSGEESIFVGNGTVSFSFLFWGHMFNGESFYEAFVGAKKSVATTYSQTPLLDANGNGTGNEKADKDLANLIQVGNETKSAGDVPVIGGVSPVQALEGATSATLYADQVIDADGISRVWAVITPPDYSSVTPDTPVTDLPTIDLSSVGNNRYEATYTNFTSSGAYNIAIFAMDRKGVLSLPVQASVSTASSCLAVGAGLSIQVPCAEYNGSRYGFLLDFYRNPDDPSGYYWKLVMATLTAGDGANCIPIATDLSMPLSCVAYNGVQYAFTLRFYNNSNDPSGLYWKMDMSTLVVR